MVDALNEQLVLLIHACHSFDTGLQPIGMMSFNCGKN